MDIEQKDISLNELEQRHLRTRKHLASNYPNVSGLLAFSRIALYYLSGTYCPGVFWLPLEGEPVLLTRRSLVRAKLESPLKNIASFSSYKEVPQILAEFNSALGQSACAELKGITWEHGKMLESHLNLQMVSGGDNLLDQTRAIKSPWELEKIRAAGIRHRESLGNLLPQSIHSKMTERQIAHKLWEIVFTLGHSGPLRMNTIGDEIFLGAICAGDNSNFPSHFNGPIGLKGEHPAVPCMGSSKIWEKNSLLAIDIGFSIEGYQTDKTQIYWARGGDSIPQHVLTAHQLCIDIQNITADNLKPGAIPSELYRHSLELAKKAGFEDGFMALAANKVPFLGHGIGLAIDEFPVLANKFDQPLQENMVIALEPKIGIPDFGMVGVENTYLVTKEGGECLTAYQEDTFKIIEVD